MNRGIDVKFTNSDESLRFLRDFAEIIDENDKIYISLLDFVGGDDDGGVTNITYNKCQFIKQLEEVRQLLFLELFLFSSDTNEYNNIIDYTSFLNSCCKIAVLCYDSIYFDIYIKDPKVLTNLFDRCKNRSHYNLEIKTDENDGRTVFNVL